jgi:hypothetical protein
VYEELRGDARLGADGSGGADYTVPAQRHVDLPPDTMFPTTHSLALLANAEAAKPFLWAHVFDGSDEEGLFGVGAAIAQRHEAAAPAEGRSPLLSAGPSWYVTLAFYPALDESAVPEHEQHLRLHANGLVEDLVLDYGDFTVSATLTKVEVLPEPGC